MKTPHLKIAALLSASVLFLSGCAPTQSAETTESPETALPQIVVTTNVWADVAAQVAGDKFEVVALISDPAQDPHSYEATARDQLAVSESSLFVINGGGYDDFALQLASAAGVEPFNIYELHETKHAHEGEEAHAHEGEEGHAHEGEEAHAHEGEEGHTHAHDGSDHIWYDLHIAELFATELSEKLAEIDSVNSQYFADNAAAFAGELEALESRVSALATAKLHYFEAHPLATLLLKELQFEDLTPEGFAEAEEAEVEPSATILQASKDVITSGELNFLAVNEQVTSPTLDSLKTLAEEQGIPVLTFDELLPEGKNYQTWFSDILTKLESLL